MVYTVIMKEAFYDSLQKSPKFNSHEEEIKFLKSELEKHTQNREHLENFESHKESVADTIIKEYTRSPIEEVVHEKSHLPENVQEGITLRLSAEEHDAVITDLYTHLVERGIKNTLALVKRMNNPHIEDDFHRFLVQYLASYYEVPGLRPASDLAKSLGLRMFEIVLPNKKTGDDRDFKHTVTLMEQFMAGMQYI